MSSLLLLFKENLLFIKLFKLFVEFLLLFSNLDENALSLIKGNSGLIMTLSGLFINENNFKFLFSFFLFESFFLSLFSLQLKKFRL